MRLSPRSIKLVFAALLSARLASAAQAAGVADNFNDNLINPNLWKKIAYGGMNVREAHGRLEMLANGYTGSLSYAGLVSKTWGIDWRSNFSLSVNYKLQIAPPVGWRNASIGFGISFASGFNPNYSGITMGIERDKWGFWLVCYIYDRGTIVKQLWSRIYAYSGVLTVHWNRAADRLTISSQNKSIALTGLWRAYGAANGSKPLVLSMGAVTEAGNMLFGWNTTTLDNFVFHGIRRIRS